MIPESAADIEVAAQRLKTMTSPTRIGAEMQQRDSRRHDDREADRHGDTPCRMAQYISMRGDLNGHGPCNAQAVASGSWRIAKARFIPAEGVNGIPSH